MQIVPFIIVKKFLCLCQPGVGRRSKKGKIRSTYLKNGPPACINYVRRANGDKANSVVGNYLSKDSHFERKVSYHPLAVS